MHGMMNFDIDTNIGSSVYVNYVCFLKYQHDAECISLILYVRR